MGRAHIVVALTVALALASVVGVAGTAVAQSGETVTVTVAVRDSAGNPISDADIDAEWDGGSTTATTAGNGKAFIDVPEGTEVSVEVEHPRYVRTSPYTIADASEREVEVEVFRKSSVRLEVSDDDGPVGNAEVLIERGGLEITTGTTDSDGVYESDIIQAGDYRVTIRKPGYYTEQKSLEIDGNVTNRVALRAGSVSVDVTVIDPHFDSPRSVNDAQVNLTGFATSRTGPDGRTVLGTPVNVRTTLQVDKEGYRGKSRDVRIGESDTNVTVEISREPSLTIEATNERIVTGERVPVVVANAYGEPAPGVTITLDGDTVGTTDTEGEFAARINESGGHTLRATDGGVRSNEVSVEAIAPPGSDTATPASPTPDATATAATETEAVTPGFTAVIAVFALLSAAFLLRRR
ncbi:carboxypeptidase regulatory-like domain-containing protein [Haloplanus sp.]|uniref:carboxypeptidase regulatory-like domain-containing protein n=1 Tax=Haloplanus sp. TaxID=1961696 RepID=UPI002602AF9A|nr:carboxypeptidase regulatory-like domain-containing protein [Haloplanus sp.]